MTVRDLKQALNELPSSCDNDEVVSEAYDWENSFMRQHEIVATRVAQDYSNNPIVILSNG